MDEINFVHIFVSRGRFANEDQLAQFVEPNYTEDGDLISSKFMTEIGLESFEPMAIERTFYPKKTDLLSAIHGFSYADQFPLVRLEPTSINTIICVYSPNTVRTPNRSSLDYVGAFKYDPNQE
jgi:hypothetical protein